MKKLFAALTALLLAVTMLSGCAPKEEPAVICSKRTVQVNH